MQTIEYKQVALTIARAHGFILSGQPDTGPTIASGSIDQRQHLA
jgi:hypothetical protein